MARVLVMLTADRGSNFRGDKCFFEEDKVQQLLAQKACVLLDEDGNPIIPEAGVVEDGNGKANAGGSEGTATGKKTPTAKGKAAKGKTNTDLNPFEIDGFDAKVIAALAEAGITNPEDLRVYVASGKSLAELPVIGTVTEKELLDLYGDVA